MQDEIKASVVIGVPSISASFQYKASEPIISERRSIAKETPNQLENFQAQDTQPPGPASKPKKKKGRRRRRVVRADDEWAPAKPVRTGWSLPPHARTTHVNLFTQFVHGPNAPSRPSRPVFSRGMATFQQQQQLQRPERSSVRSSGGYVASPRVMPAMHQPSVLRQMELPSTPPTLRPPSSARPVSARSARVSFDAPPFVRPASARQERPTSATPPRPESAGSRRPVLKSKVAVIPFMPPPRPLPVATRRHLLCGAQRTFVRMSYNSPLAYARVKSAGALHDDEYLEGEGGQPLDDGQYYDEEGEGVDYEFVQI